MSLMGVGAVILDGMWRISYGNTAVAASILYCIEHMASGYQQGDSMEDHSHDLTTGRFFSATRIWIDHGHSVAGSSSSCL